MATAAAKRETQKVIALLGGNRVFRDKIADASDMQQALRKGLPYAAFEEFLATLEVRSQDLADLLGVAARTLARRKTARHLSPIESDRLYRVAHIAHLAAETLGSLERARAWLHQGNRALGGHSPISLLDTEIGKQRVENLLLQIDHGIHS